MKRASIIGVLIVVALFAAYLSSQREPSSDGMPGGSDLGSTEPGVVGRSAAHSSPAEAKPSSARLQQASPGVAVRVGAAEAKRLRGAILAEVLRPSPSPSPSAKPAARDGRDAATAGPPAAVPTLDRKYIRSAIGEIVPLIRECFELGRQARPELRQARAIVHFSIIGDEQLGGVVEESRLDDSSEGMTPELTECVRETMYSLKLPAPEGEGRVEVTYPFLMSEAPPETEPAAADGEPKRAAQ